MRSLHKVTSTAAVLAILMFSLHLCAFQASTHHSWIDLVVSFTLGRTPAVKHESPLPPKSFDISSIFAANTKLLPNHHITSLLRCTHKVNNMTGSIRLPNLIQNISLTPPGGATDEPEKKYFNPTIIQLPPHSPYPYLLLSRLVTQGLHQESHICLATLCHPQHPDRPHSLPVGVKACSDSDIEVLGTRGGIRCANEPERLNIPPTPALRCEEAWAAFPDIPGFHDPRVFWNGRDEPLVILNSGSQYACVGLWIVDLRAVYPEIRDLLGREGRYIGLDAKRDNERIELPSPMSYPYLTELTRNGRTSRNAVEKNWVLFFPTTDESWVQYDLVSVTGHGNQVEEFSKGTGAQKAATGSPSLSDEANSDNLTDVFNRAAFALTTSIHTEYFNSSATDFRPRSNNTSRLNVTILEQGNSRSIPKPHAFKPKRTLIPGRSLAKLVGSGYTTPNLTASNEIPCLTTADMFDRAENQGHWHQGSNSLRLILCSRHDLVCYDSSNESDLVSQGKVVHLAVLHRKFSNDLKLPMRYERYVMIWEARFPFRMLAISRHPFLFAGEKAQPWDDAEDESATDGTKKWWTDVYFTYTPSLTWSWRKDSKMLHNQSTNTGLGTGYLGDDVLIGIGMDDTAQGVVRVKVDDLLECLRLCPDFATSG